MTVLADRVKETTTTTGTGTVNLGGADAGYQTFVAGVGDGEETNYCITDGTDWEVGIGTVTDASPDTLSRTTIIASSNGGAAVNWGSGSKDVFATASASVLPHWGETVEPSAAGVLDFDISGVESVRLVGWLQPATDAVDLGVRFSNDGGSSFRAANTDYDSVVHYGYAHDDSTAVLGETGLTYLKLGQNIGNGASEGVEFDIRIVNPSDANWFTSVLGEIGEVDLGGNKFYANVGGRVRSTKEVNDSVRLLFSSGNIAAGRVSVYRYPAVG